MGKCHLITGQATLLSTGLSDHLSHKKDIIVKEVSYNESKINLAIQKNIPDVIWLEISNTKIDAYTLCEYIHNEYSQVQIVVFGGNKDVKLVKKFIHLGVSAYLHSNCSLIDVDAAISNMLQNRVYIANDLHQYMMDCYLGLDTPDGTQKSLTRREQEILNLIIEENTTQEIASKLYINTCTVETHRLHLIQKMGVKNTAGLVREAFCRKLYV